MRLGTVLCAKWRLDALLGTGGMATVYAATHRNGKRVAVKVLHASLSSSEEARSRFLSEGYAVNAIQHPGVVSVLDDDVTDDGAVFFVMDLLEGETLEARAHRSGGRLPVGEVVALAGEVLDVLAAAHGAGVVHRDIKPENVFLTRGGQVKVLDFGIARVREISGSSGRTQTGALMGTPAFMPPEQARGRWDEVDARSDVWAVGATMFTLLAGRSVHSGETTNELLLSAMATRAPSLAQVCPDAPEAVVALVDRALAYEREARWADASEMLAAVREALGASAGAPIPAGVAPTIPTLLEASRQAALPASASAPEAPPLPSTALESAISFSAMGLRPGPRRGAVLAVAGVGAVVVLVGALLAVHRGGSPAPTRKPEVAASVPLSPLPSVADPEPGAAIPTLAAETVLAPPIESPVPGHVVPAATWPSPAPLRPTVTPPAASRAPTVKPSSRGEPDPLDRRH